MPSFARAVSSSARQLVPHAVAAFVVFHVAAMAVDFVPDVRMGLDKKSWQEPRVRVELDRWAERLGVERAALETWAFGAGVKLNEARTLLHVPFEPYLKATGQRQSWAMFVAGTRHRDRFQVRARACTTCAWHVLYERGDAEHAFLRSELEHPRVRSGTFRWGWPNGKKSYGRGCRAIARRVFAARADFVEVQCRFERSLAPDPREAAAEGTSASKAKARADQPSWGREQRVLRRDVETGAP